MGVLWCIPWSMTLDNLSDPQRLQLPLPIGKLGFICIAMNKKKRKSGLLVYLNHLPCMYTPGLVETMHE
jgi:hypothetical protein